MAKHAGKKRRHGKQHTGRNAPSPPSKRRQGRKPAPKHGKPLEFGSHPTMQVLELAKAARHRVKFQYVKEGSARSEQRRATPTDFGDTYWVGYDHDRGDYRRYSYMHILGDVNFDYTTN